MLCTYSFVLDWKDLRDTVEEFNNIRCINGKLEANDGQGGLYLILQTYSSGDNNAPKI
jgi:hypothetical protein